jgi:hypothetical protein
MKRFAFAVCAAGLLALAASHASAATITITPSTPSVAVGGQVSVDLTVSGLGDGAAPSLGTYDLDLLFDGGLLGVSSVTFGNQLDLFGLGGLQITDNSVLGTLNIFELSLDTVDDLNNLQFPSFRLATITFDTLSAGIAALTLGVNAFGDALGDPLDVTTGSASFEITSVSEVPIPGALPLMMSAIGGFFGFTRLRSRRAAIAA